MSIDANNFKSDLELRFIELLDSERGIQARLAESVNKPGSYFSEVKRGKPVNAIHLKAVGILFGFSKVAELMAIDSVNDSDGSVDSNILSQIIEAVEEGLSVRSKVATPAKKAEFIAFLYEYFTETGKDVSKEVVERHLRLVA